ncbi:hypothetical protein bthur0013_22200 [Bacillus thuringiensis IBL 200]|nr:hypothetical protein [Bacillus thuringiensis]EEM96282.1 hypothetical protein bthur0013_22200 [Bacillus thuringiensis IBL 200]
MRSKKAVMRKNDFIKGKIKNLQQICCHKEVLVLTSISQSKAVHMIARK